MGGVGVTGRGKLRPQLKRLRNVRASSVTRVPSPLNLLFNVVTC